MEGFRHVDEVDGRLAADVAVADEVAEESGVIWRDWLMRAETQEAAWPRHSVAAGEFSREAPATLGQDLVVRRDPQLGIVAQPETDDLLLTLIEPGLDLAHA